MSVVAMIMAAGSARRMVKDYIIPKQYLDLGGIPVIRHSINAFLENKLVTHIIVIINKDHESMYRSATADLDILDPVIGGDRRQDSVRNGLHAIQHLNPRKVLIHDAARPFINKKIITNVIKELDYSGAAIPAISIDDTIKKCNDGKVLWTVDRDDLWRAQTPQAFRYADILKHHEIYKDQDFTDDSALNEHAGMSVTIIPGSWNNFKITTDDDYDRAKNIINQMKPILQKESRVGNGYDIHKFDTQTKQKDTKIVLGGIHIPFQYPIIAHSDGDVLLHSITDAILGAIGHQDIGSLFPGNDDNKDRNSVDFIKKAVDILKCKNGRIVNLDVNIITQKPKISQYRQSIVDNLSKILDIEDFRISIKGKTKEGLDAVGRQEAIEVFASVMVEIVL